MKGVCQQVDFVYFLRSARRLISSGIADWEKSAQRSNKICLRLVEQARSWARKRKESLKRTAPIGAARCGLGKERDRRAGYAGVIVCGKM
jgi:hypothetical protein